MSKEKFEVIVAGHICFDIIPKLFNPEDKDFFEAFKPGKLIVIGDNTTSTGGPVSNTGIGLLKLGTKTGFMGKVGNDFLKASNLQKLTSKLQVTNPVFTPTNLK